MGVYFSITRLASTAEIPLSGGIGGITYGWESPRVHTTGQSRYTKVFKFIFKGQYEFLGTNVFY